MPPARRQVKQDRANQAAQTGCEHKHDWRRARADTGRDVQALGYHGNRGRAGRPLDARGQAR